jgi:hypothetical protein
MRTEVILATILAFIAILTFQAGIVEAQRIVKDGLISYWSFDKIDIEGDVAKDVWGGNDGTFAGELEIVKGKVGEALNLNGVDQYVDMGSPANGSLDFGQDKDLTIATWINVSEPSADEYTIVCKGDRGGSSRILLKVSPGIGMIFALADPDTEDILHGVIDVVDGKWHYIVAVADRDEFFSIYVDGVVDVDGGISNDANVDTDSSFFIGKSHQEGSDERRFFNGFIDEVCIYNRVLSEQEILQNQAAQGIAVEPASDKIALTWGKIKTSEHTLF